MRLLNNNSVETSHAWAGRRLEKAPHWCSVDLRDGNQALPCPLTPQAKLEFFRLLVKTGFREIEIGFPSASKLDWDFCQTLIETKAIPDDVSVSVLMPARESLIKKTMTCLKGVRKAICHLFVPTSDLHTKFVLGRSQARLEEMVVDSVKLIRKLADEQPDCTYQLEFSPEEFSDSDLNFAVEICSAAVAAWQPRKGERVILNLPCTVERMLPTQYADRVEAFIAANPFAEQSIISIHTHNDMGTAVAQAELALLAGAERVEGTLFGNGERAGNLDLVTLAINFQVMGIDSGLDFSDLETLRDKVMKLTGLPVGPRHPYAGALAFTAFSGTHQDAIHKGLSKQDKISRYFGHWKLPYLNIDPAMLGRRYQDFIRINSQSGKGGIEYVLEQSKNVTLPEGLVSELRQLIKDSDREFSPDDLWQLLLDTYLVTDGALQLLKYWPHPDSETPSVIHAEVLIRFNGAEQRLEAADDGPVAAFAAAVRCLKLPKFLLESYHEQALGTSVNADSLTAVDISSESGNHFYGLGMGTNIVQGAAQAIISAINRMLDSEEHK